MKSQWKRLRTNDNVDWYTYAMQIPGGVLIRTIELWEDWKTAVVNMEFVPMTDAEADKFFEE